VFACSDDEFRTKHLTKEMTVDLDIWLTSTSRPYVGQVKRNVSKSNFKVTGGQILSKRVGGHCHRYRYYF